MNDSEKLALMREALEHIRKQPCLTRLLGEDPRENDGGFCGCAGCTAAAVLWAIDKEPA